MHARVLAQVPLKLELVRAQLVALLSAIGELGTRGPWRGDLDAPGGHRLIAHVALALASRLRLILLSIHNKMIEQPQTLLNCLTCKATQPSNSIRARHHTDACCLLPRDGGCLFQDIVSTLCYEHHLNKLLLRV